jgi:hypothetical protein
MKRNFLYQITAASRTPDQGATAPRSPFSLTSTEFVEPPLPQTKFLGTPLLHDQNGETLLRIVSANAIVHSNVHFVQQSCQFVL